MRSFIKSKLIRILIHILFFLTFANTQHMYEPKILTADTCKNNDCKNDVHENGIFDEDTSNTAETNNELNDDAKTVEKEKQPYEFPQLLRLDPVAVGHKAEIYIKNGQSNTRITRAVNPPVFEIPDFLSQEECETIILSAKKNGLNTSTLFGADIEDELADGRNSADVSRISETTWLYKKDMPDGFWFELHQRLARLTLMDIDFIRRGEPVQIVKYGPGGHYHAHHDSVETDKLPCCFQTNCGSKHGTKYWNTCCRICRYITVLYYLNDVEEGGETAYPWADLPADIIEKLEAISEIDTYNLSRYCHNSSLVVSPKRGTAIMWYNHVIDEKTGYLGNLDKRSLHGGCDIIKGTKWIANNWLSSPPYEDRFKASNNYEEP